MSEHIERERGVLRRHDKAVIDAALDLASLNVSFGAKPLVIGGLAMEYHGLRKRGGDIDLVVAAQDYETLAARHPDCRKDIWGDLGVVLGEYEIWRSIGLLDYDFLAVGSDEYEEYSVISFDRLFLMRVMARGTPKYEADMQLMLERYFEGQPATFVDYMMQHKAAYQREPGGVIWKGEYRI